MNRTEYISTIAPVAVKVRIEGGPLLPSVSIAQTILETGGKIHDWNNIVGYKVGRGRQTDYWRGRSVSTKTWEVYDGVRDDDVDANWRAYDSIEDCLKDQALLLLNNDRYKRVVADTSPATQAQALKDCGYATDPDYASKIQAIIRSGGLESYDQEAKESMEILKQMQARMDELQKTNESLKRQVNELQEANQEEAPPEWAEATIKRLMKTPVKNGTGFLLSNPKGDSSFHRVMVVLDRAGVFNQ